jgi:uncharacterized protein (TIGR02118 family)
MHRMTILYGTPDDPAAFRDYYESAHIPVARRMRGLTGWNLSWIDPGADGGSGIVLIAELYAESSEAMDAVLASPEGLAASADLDNFVTGTVTFVRGDEVEVALA